MTSVRILIVEDDEMQRHLLRAQLQQMGHSVVEACNGNEALRLLRSDPVQMVITDVLMPDKDGLETIIELQNSYPELPIVAISGGGASFLPLAKVLGAVMVLAKPFTQAELQTALQVALPKSPKRCPRPIPGNECHG